MRSASVCPSTHCVPLCLIPPCNQRSWPHLCLMSAQGGTTVCISTWQGKTAGIDGGWHVILIIFTDKVNENKLSTGLCSSVYSQLSICERIPKPDSILWFLCIIGFCLIGNNYCGLAVKISHPLTLISHISCAAGHFLGHMLTFAMMLEKEITSFKILNKHWAKNYKHCASFWKLRTCCREE